MAPSKTRVLAPLLLLAALACGGRPATEPSPQAAEPPPDLRIANAARPGEALDLQSHLSKDRTTLVEFYSDQCPPCREMERVMEYLAQQKRDLAVRRVNIDRRGHAGIDFDSPLAEQHGIDAVPAFRIYSPQGRLVASGTEAKDQVRQWYSDAQLVERAERPDMRGISERYREQE